MNDSCSGGSLAACSRPSTVVISRPWACTANIVHDLIGRPSSKTVQAPQCVVSHPMWVPGSRSVARMRCTSRRRGSTSASCFSPLIATLTSIVSASLLRALDRLAERPGGPDPHPILPVRDRSSQVLLGLCGLRGELGRALDGGLVGPLAHERGLRPRCLCPPGPAGRGPA